MKDKLTNLTLLIFIILEFSCSNNSNESKVNLQDYFIQWDDSSLVCISETGGYPRMTRLPDNSLMAVFEDSKGGITSKKSYDEGATWENPVCIAENFNFKNPDTNTESIVNYANPEILVLKNGDLLLVSNQRPKIDGVYPFSISLQRSKDNGATWSEPDILYQAGTEFNNGCWEPSFLMMTDGTIQIYFANESPYKLSNEQEISLLSSKNNGYNWTDQYKTVSFRKGKRDGMPVALLHEGNIYVAIEDNLSKEFKPYIIKNNSKNPWENPVLENSELRYSALKTPLNENVYAGAPYFIRTNDGIFILSYQTTENRTTDWEHSTMEVAISDTPDNFRNKSQPFNVPLSKEAKWNSLFDLGDNNIAALSATNFNSDKIGIWLKKGKIVKK